MQELEKILEIGEIIAIEELEEENERCNRSCEGCCSEMKEGKCYCKDALVISAIKKLIERIELCGDGWIPVEKEFPPLGQRLQATILHHEWVSDYDSSWVPDDEKVYHPAYTEVCEIYSVGAMWYYACAENDYLCDVAYVFPLKVLSNPVAEIIAWKQYPEPYRSEQPETCKYTGGSCCYPIDQCRECPNHPERSEDK